MPEQETPAASSSTESIVAPSWWVRLCRWLWRVLLFVWGTLVVGIVIGTIANLNTTTTDTPLSKLYLIHVAMTYPLPTIASIGILVLLTILSWTGSKEHPVTTPHSPSQQNRLHFLHRLRFIYDQMMTDSLQDAAWLEVGLASKPDSVQNVSPLLLRTPTQPERLLPAGTSIVEFYEQANHELLILGEPGTGKSMLLVRLAQHLLEQAVQDEALPLPIILPLSSWAVKQLPLQKWIGEQISLMYDVPRRFSQHWVQEERLLLLLDGLDEMEEGARTACIAAINTYHHDHLHPLVVCSRTEEYTVAAASERLALQQAIIVQALTPAQVDTYLGQAGKPLAALSAALSKNPTLASLATTPLMLHVLMLTYQGTSVTELSHKEAQLRKHIWDDYVQRMVSYKGDIKRYPLHRTSAWLSWLAQRMRENNQAIFLPELIKLSWLPKGQRVFYRYCTLLFFGLVTGLGAGLFAALLFGLRPGPALVLGGGPTSELLWGLGGGLFFGLIFGLTFGLPDELINGLLWGLVTGLIGGLFFGFLGRVGGGLLFGMVTGLGAGLLSGLLYVLIGGLFFGLGIGLSDMLISWLFFGLFGGLPLGLIVGLLFWLGGGLIGGLGAGLLFWLLCGLIGWPGDTSLPEEYLEGLLTEHRILPLNEGIRRSTKSGLRWGLGYGLLNGLSAGLLSGLFDGLPAGIVVGLLFGLFGGLFWGLLQGLSNIVKHYTLRLWLSRTHLFPWKATPFLEDATTRVLLRRVGGGYSFIHRLLLDHFADLNAEPTLASATPPSAPSPPPSANPA